MKILLTGGSACGKSSFAEKLAVQLPGPRYYIATMRPYDEECLQKIARHRILRADKGFETIEQHTNLEEIVLPQRGTALLECMCNLTANEMFDEEGSTRDAYDSILRGMDSLSKQCQHLIVVTNDVGGGCDCYSEETLEYVRLLGRLNKALAQRADCVCELVCGIPLLLKGELP